MVIRELPEDRTIHVETSKPVKGAFRIIESTGYNRHYLAFLYVDTDDIVRTDEWVSSKEVLIAAILLTDDPVEREEAKNLLKKYHGD
jgi:hypothetical protein